MTMNTIKVLALSKILTMKTLHRGALFLLILTAFLLRVYKLNWDQGFHLHPDERWIVMVTERISLPKAQEWQKIFTAESSLNPHFFAYGSFPLYLLKISSYFVSLLLGKIWLTYSTLNLLGRVLSAIFDIGTIVILLKISRRLFDERVALLAAFLYGTCVFAIQLSHFYTVDVILSFFVILTLYRLVEFYDRTTLGNAVLVGLSFGLSLSTKISASVLIVSILTALSVDIILIFLKSWRRRHREQWVEIRRYGFKSLVGIIYERLLKKFVPYLLIIGLTSIITFVFTEPYAIIDFKNFWIQINDQHRMTKDAYVFPYTLQYVGTTPYLYYLKNIFLWGMGIFLGSITTIGFIYYMYDLSHRLAKPGDYNREARELIILVFAIVYFAIVGRFAIKFMRYLLPIYPILVLWGAKFLTDLSQKISQPLKTICFFGFCLGHLSWLALFMSIYSKPNTRVQASQWINQNIPSGSSIAIEHWDDALPLWGGGKYHLLEMPMYEPDQSLVKWKIVSDNLETADYLVLASNRLYTPLQRLADCSKYRVCYMQTAQYYHDLFSGELGFQKVAEFKSYPSLNLFDQKFEIIDDSADESFTVYDHPRVIVFKKTNISEQFTDLTQEEAY